MSEISIMVSIYPTPEEVNRHCLVNKALDLMHNSQPLHTNAKTVLEALTLFRNSWQYREFEQQHYPNCYFYRNDEHGNTVPVYLSPEESAFIEDLYT